MWLLPEDPEQPLQTQAQSICLTSIFSVWQKQVSEEDDSAMADTVRACPPLATPPAPQHGLRAVWETSCQSVQTMREVRPLILSSWEGWDHTAAILYQLLSLPLPSQPHTSGRQNTAKRRNTLGPALLPSLATHPWEILASHLIFYRLSVSPSYHRKIK